MKRFLAAELLSNGKDNILGQIKRTIKGWAEEINKVWNRFNTFHRVVLGICLSMVLVYAVRVKYLDPMQEELLETYKEMDDSDIPANVPAVDNDEDIQELQLRIENLTKSSEHWSQQMNNALNQRPQIYRTNLSEVISEFELLIDQSELKLRNRNQANSDDNIKQQNQIEQQTSNNFPLNILKYRYELEGSFKYVYSFLEKASTFSYPACLSSIKIVTANNLEGISYMQGEDPQITLSFYLELYYHD